MTTIESPHLSNRGIEWHRDRLQRVPTEARRSEHDAQLHRERKLRLRVERWRGGEVSAVCIRHDRCRGASIHRWHRRSQCGSTSLRCHSPIAKSAAGEKLKSIAVFGSSKVKNAWVTFGSS